MKSNNTGKTGDNPETVVDLAFKIKERVARENNGGLIYYGSRKEFKKDIKRTEQINNEDLIDRAIEEAGVKFLN